MGKAGGKGKDKDAEAGIAAALSCDPSAYGVPADCASVVLSARAADRFDPRNPIRPRVSLRVPGSSGSIVVEAGDLASEVEGLLLRRMRGQLLPGGSCFGAALLACGTSMLLLLEISLLCRQWLDPVSSAAIAAAVVAILAVPPAKTLWAMAASRVAHEQKIPILLSAHERLEAALLVASRKAKRPSAVRTAS